jgi:hypothetical protein
MKLTGLRSLLQETSAFQNLLAYLKSDQPNMDLSLGVIRSARPFAVATLAQSWGRRNHLRHRSPRKRL